ncbi:hypothetical protein EJD97_002503, partial [Solanum chilense]
EDNQLCNIAALQCMTMFLAAGNIAVVRVCSIAKHGCWLLVVLQLCRSAALQNMDASCYCWWGLEALQHCKLQSHLLAMA